MRFYNFFAAFLLQPYRNIQKTNWQVQKTVSHIDALLVFLLSFDLSPFVK